MLLNDLSYSARSGARPTRPKRWVVVKEHLPANLRASSGVMLFVCRWLCSSCNSRQTLLGQGLTDTCWGSHWMMTPCILCSLSGRCSLDGFMWNPRMEFNCAKV